MPKKSKPQYVVVDDDENEIVEFPAPIYVVVREYEHEGYDNPIVACLNRTYAERMAKKAGEDYGVHMIQLVSIPEEWEGWPTNPANIKKRALAKLTPEERKALGF